MGKNSQDERGSVGRVGVIDGERGWKRRLAAKRKYGVGDRKWVRRAGAEFGR